MKILIIRHADPDYSIDSLTPQGRIEAELLSQKLCKMDIKAFYVSVLGRAKDTAEYTLKKLNRKAVECEWLKEFGVVIDKPNRKNSIPWDWLPKDWTDSEEFYSINDWYKHKAMADGKVIDEYRRVTSELDNLLKSHGYEHNGRYFNAVNANEDTIAFFCHFGVECVLLSHLLGISPMLLWHGFCAAPSSVTSIVTEEREKGIAYFRVSSFGDVSHLYAGGEEPSFAARFCETYDNKDQRHD